MDAKVKIKHIIMFIVVILSSILAYAIGFDSGYSRAMDNLLDASECKPSWKWRQRI